jgi:hypothetical protein
MFQCLDDRDRKWRVDVRTVLLPCLERMTKFTHLPLLAKEKSSPASPCESRELDQPIHLSHLLLLQRCRIYSWLAASAAEMGAVIAPFSLEVERNGKLIS